MKVISKRVSRTFMYILLLYIERSVGLLLVLSYRLAEASGGYIATVLTLFINLNESIGWMYTREPYDSIITL